MTVRYCADCDAKAVAQIWRECGWIEELSTESGTVRKYLEAAEDGSGYTSWSQRYPLFRKTHEYRLSGRVAKVLLNWDDSVQHLWITIPIKSQVLLDFTDAARLCAWL